MSECSVVSELLNANEWGKREFFSSDDSTIDGNCKSSGNESESSTEIIISIYIKNQRDATWQYIY